MRTSKIDLIRISAVLVVILGIIYFYLNIFSPHSIPKTIQVGVLKSPLNILIVGTDITYDAETHKPMPQLDGRADTILLAQINPLKNEIKVLSIPRDIYLKIPGYGKMRINTANALGGIELTKQVVSDFTNQRIDYYIQIKPSFIAKLVDLLGGVSIQVEKDMYYTDRVQGLNINLKKGRQKLNGSEAHDYIRFRYDAEGDWGRIRRQQQFLKALSRAAVKPANIARLPFTIQSLMQEVKTDLPLAKGIRLANAVRMLDLKEVKTITATGEEIYIRGVGEVLIPDKKIIEKIVKELF